MSFVPPRCPHGSCPNHSRPRAGFYRNHGYYRPRCRRRPVPRFRCRFCLRTFSRQTFRYDYRDRYPHTNAPLFALLTGGVGLRQAGRTLGLDVHSVQDKLRKLGRHCQQLHDNLSPSLPSERTYLLDEEETYEGASIRPLTMPVMIERDTWFVVATAVGSIRRAAPAGTARRRRQAEDERKHGRRRDESSRRVRETMKQLQRRLPAGRFVLQTDQKASYATIAHGLFGSRVRHETTSSRRVRTTHNPLFPINVTLAMTRDNCGRLRRRSWLVTKKASRLRAHLHVFTVYRNYVRYRFNTDRAHECPAWFLKLLPRALRSREVLAWRQDWQQTSIHPISRSGRRCIARIA